MEEVALQQFNQIQFPTTDKWDPLKMGVFYISDIHLDHHIFEGKAVETYDNDAMRSEIQAIVQNIFGKNRSIVEFDKHDIILFCGDIANRIELVKLFFSCFIEQFPTAQNIYYVLGNHELSEFETISDCYKEYSELEQQFSIRVLLNNYDVLSDNAGNPIAIVMGGVGFSKYNQIHNVNNLCYSKDLMGNREKEIAESEKFAQFYGNCLTAARKATIPLIVASHCPIDDWLTANEISSQCIYFYGHNHQNKYVRNSYKTIYADNQIGYTGTIEMKYCVFGLRYDPFAELSDGYHQISLEEYKAYYRYIGESLSEPKFIKKVLSNEQNKLYIIKHNGYYGFFITTAKGTRICQGGNIKIISQVSEIAYFDDIFMRMVNIFLEAMRPYRAVQEQISKEVRRLGMDGTIHGCIVDCDFYNHISLNPFDGSVTFYYAPRFGMMQQFETLEELIGSVNESRFITTRGGKLLKKQKNVLLTLREENALICHPINVIQEYVNQVAHVDLKNSIYSVSRRVNQWQRLFTANLLRDWDDEIAQSFLECDSTYRIDDKLNCYQLVRKHWKNLIDIPKEKINEKIVQAALKGNKKAYFPYLSCEKDGCPIDRAPDDMIAQFISCIPADYLASDECFRTLRFALFEDMLKFYPIEYLTHSRFKSCMECCGYISFLENIPYIEAIIDDQEIKIEIGKFMLEHLRDAVTNIELLPEKWKTESLFQYLGEHMTQKYRPKWCSPNVWKYRAT